MPKDKLEDSSETSSRNTCQIHAKVYSAVENATREIDRLGGNIEDLYNKVNTLSEKVVALQTEKIALEKEVTLYKNSVASLDNDIETTKTLANNAFALATSAISSTKHSNELIAKDFNEIRENISFRSSIGKYLLISGWAAMLISALIWSATFLFEFYKKNDQIQEIIKTVLESSGSGNKGKINPSDNK